MVGTPRAFTWSATLQLSRYNLLLQEITCLGGLERQRGNWAFFGWQCLALKQITPKVVALLCDKVEKFHE
jgi:hypothetical protein